ncbi:hypothetical protein LO80_03410 [Candidatus Francisella endociliophora]|uniref:Uncharacterized protein n=1 Tax=Candidatus Francisella endociliophora TaxID=653937 RepID=A0A097ENG3_9GAMM|nr:hypothetical protein [Francisella sp. FSC1006]AIT09107.1 hypothetical protein LO80_03410 [Francisella sp. FSC1006]
MTTKTLINDECHDVTEYYKTVDLSDAYADELDNLEVSSINNEEMKTFLFECLDEEAERVWDVIRYQYMPHSSYNHYQLIDFDSGYLDDSYEIEIKLSDDISVIADVNVFFDIDYDFYDPRYDDCDCYHKYTAKSVAINKFQVTNTQIKNLPALVA